MYLIDDGYEIRVLAGEMGFVFTNRNTCFALFCLFLLSMATSLPIRILRRSIQAIRCHVAFGNKAKNRFHSDSDPIKHDLFYLFGDGLYKSI